MFRSLFTALNAALLLGSSAVIAGGGETPASFDRELSDMVIGVEAEREAVIREQLPLTPEEAEAFWPIYQRYRVAMGGNTDRVVEWLKTYAGATRSGGVKEEQAMSLINEFLAVELDDHKVRREYAEKLMKVLPAVKVMRFFQLEHRMDLMVESAAAREIPIIPIPAAQ